MCIVLLTAQNLPKVAPKPMRAIITFQVKGSGGEVDAYDKGVIVTHQAKGVVGTQWFAQYLSLSGEKRPSQKVALGLLYMTLQVPICLQPPR